MKLVLVLMLCALAAAAPKTSPDFSKVQLVNAANDATVTNAERSSILINALVRQLINYIRYLINNGSSLFGFGPLDPLEIDSIHLNIPAGLINLEMDLENVLATGFGGFVVQRSNLNVRELTFDIEITVPRIDVSCKYGLLGDLFTAVPLYGKGDATFVVENFSFKALLHLKQSEDGSSILIDRIENASFQVPHVESNMSGVIGGGDIDRIANSIVEEVLIGYVNRFQGVIALGASQALIHIGNPILNTLDTWRYIAPFV